jgi:hypothetical protein
VEFHEHRPHIGEPIGAVFKNGQFCPFDIELQQIDGLVEPIAESQRRNHRNRSLNRLIKAGDGAGIGAFTDEVERPIGRPDRGGFDVEPPIPAIERQIAAANGRQSWIRFKRRQPGLRIATLEVDGGETYVGAAVEDARLGNVAVKGERLTNEDVLPLRPCRHRVDILEAIWGHRNLSGGPSRLPHCAPFELPCHGELGRGPDVMVDITGETSEMREQW